MTEEAKSKETCIICPYAESVPDSISLIGEEISTDLLACINPKSKHYGHMLTIYHPMCEETEKPILWTYEVHLEMYRGIVQRFGSHMEWGLKSYPVGRKDEYDAYLAGCCRKIGAKEKGGAQMQIRYATSMRLKTLTDPRHTKAMIFNKTAAKNAGFIDDSYLKFY